MANLKYSDKHNMVAFLKKPNESVGFTEVVEFLKGTSLMYALTHNLTVYDSLVKQFWQTATVRTLVNGTQQLVAYIDSKEYTINEASIRSKLQLTDATGIHNLSDAEIYDGLATLATVITELMNDTKIERLLKYMELHDVSYGIEYVARPLLLFFSSENQLLWFRHGYAVSSLMDTAYWSSE
ncbi:hypothetical protein Tco_1490853 [Tanacetum coccineum]